MNGAEFDYIRELVRTRAAIVLEPGKEYLVTNRLEPVARAAGLEGVSALVRVLRQGNGGGAALRAQVVEALTTNETSFFRDAKMFQVLGRQVLPTLRRAAAGRRLRIWSAACSTGQEPYTLALMLREQLRWQAEDVEIVATDLSTQVLEKARQGEYSQLEVNRGLPARLLVKYFQRSGSRWKVKDELKSMVRFEQLNLIESWPRLGDWDLVLLRNVLIYFDVDTKRSILQGVRRRLSPGGLLVLGTAETTLQIDDHYERVDFGEASAYRSRGQAAQGTPLAADLAV